jgi:hypothetical protein
MHTDPDQELFEHAYQKLMAELPEPVARVLFRLRAPDMKCVRLTTGVLFIAGGSMAFLPVLGLELLPLGMLFLAQDVAFLRPPTAKLLLWLLRRWSELKQWLTRWTRTASAQSGASSADAASFS